jgi:hypothetical protein
MTLRARLSARPSRASITRSAWSAARAGPRVRSGVKAYSFFSLPDYSRVSLMRALTPARQKPPVRSRVPRMAFVDVV